MRRSPKGLWPACGAVSIGLHAWALWVGSGILMPQDHGESAHAVDAPMRKGRHTDWFVVLPTAARAQKDKPAGAQPAPAARTLSDAVHPPLSGPPTSAVTPPVTPALTPAPVFWRPEEVDKIALPLADLDAKLLDGMLGSGLPVRLRVYIDASGRVAAVQAAQSLPDDQDAVARLTAMLQATRFAPARRAGRDVDSVQELEFTFEPVAAPPAKPSLPAQGR